MRVKPAVQKYFGLFPIPCQHFSLKLTRMNYSRLLSAFALLATACNSGGETEPDPDPELLAYFDYVTPSALTPFEFVNKSTGATRYLWRWGDGSPNSTDASPRHVFPRAGQFSVKLIARGPAGVDSLERDIMVRYPYERFVGRYHGSFNYTSNNPQNGVLEVAMSANGNQVIVLGMTTVGPRYQQRWQGPGPNRSNLTLALPDRYGSLNSNALQLALDGDTVSLYTAEVTRQQTSTTAFYGIRIP